MEELLRHRVQHGKGTAIRKSEPGGVRQGIAVYESAEVAAGVGRLGLSSKILVNWLAEKATETKRG